MPHERSGSTFHRETWRRACHVFMLLALKKATAKTYFLHYDILVKTLYTILNVLLQWNVSITSAVTYKQRFLHEHVILQYL